MLRIRTKNQSGFTLAETVMAVVILGVTLGASVMGFSMAMKAVYTSRNQLQALHYSRDELEGLHSYSFSNSVYSAGTHTISNSTSPATTRSRTSTLTRSL